MDSNTEPLNSENKNQMWERLAINSNYVDQIAISPDGKIVASLCDRSLEFLKIWDVVSGELLYVSNWRDLFKIPGVEENNVDITFCYSSSNTIFLYSNPEGNTLVITTYGNALIYDLEQGKIVRGKLLKSPFDPRDCGYEYPDPLYQNVLVSPDLQIAATTYDSYTNFWEISSERKLHTFCVEKVIFSSDYAIYHHEMFSDMGQFSADGKVCASLILIYHGGWRKELIKVWEVETGVELCSMTRLGEYTGEHTRSVFALNSDGRILASSFGRSSKPYDLTVIFLSETITGEEICRFQNFELQDILIEEFVGLGKFISSAFDKFVSIFRPVRRKMCVILRNHCIIRRLGWGLIKLSQKFVFGIMWTLGLISRSKYWGVERDKQVVSLAFSPNDQLLAIGDMSGTITLWQLQKGSLEPTRKIWTWTIVSKRPIKTLVFSQDGQTLATGQGDYDGAITLWDVKSGKKLRTIPGHTATSFQVFAKLFNSYLSPCQVAVSPDGKIIATIDKVGVIRLWDAKTGSCLRCLNSSAKKITFSRRGKFLVSSNSYCGDIVLWEVSTGKKIQSMRPDPDYRPYSSSSYHDRPWHERDLNQYGDLLAIRGKSTNFHHVNLQIMQIPTGKIVCTLVIEDEFPQKIIFSPDKRFVATRHSISEFAIWDIATGNLIRTIITDYAEGDIEEERPYSVVFSPDGKILAIAGRKKITLWQVSSGEKIHTINRIDKYLPYDYSDGYNLAFSPNGETLAFNEHIFTDGNGVPWESIKLWDVKTAKEICILESEQIYSDTTCLYFSGNGEVLVRANMNGNISVWQQKRV